MQTKALEQVLTEFIEVTPGIGLRIHGWEEDRPYALIPGWTLPEEIYDYQMSRLSKTGVRAVSIPLPRFGKSKSPWETYDYYLFIGDILAIANHLDLSAVTLCGHTMGGAIAIHYTSIRGSHLTSRLALFGAPAQVSSQRATPSSELEVLGEYRDIKALDGDEAFTMDEAEEHAGKKNTLINAGVATWFLCQGWANHAGTGSASLRACCA